MSGKKKWKCPVCMTKSSNVHLICRVCLYVHKWVCLCEEKHLSEEKNCVYCGYTYDQYVYQRTAFNIPVPEPVDHDVEKLLNEIFYLKKDISKLTLENTKLQEKVTLLEDGYLCSVCNVKPRDHIPKCNHLSCCGDCLSRLVECPICRVKITEITKVFIN